MSDSLQQFFQQLVHVGLEIILADFSQFVGFFHHGQRLGVNAHNDQPDIRPGALFVQFVDIGPVASMYSTPLISSTITFGRWEVMRSSSAVCSLRR